MGVRCAAATRLPSPIQVNSKQQPPTVRASRFIVNMVSPDDLALKMFFAERQDDSIKYPARQLLWVACPEMHVACCLSFLSNGAASWSLSK
jgi:hypothetical protein